MWLLISLKLRLFWGQSLHYICDPFGPVGERELEVVEQHGQVIIGSGDRPEPDFLARCGGSNDIERANLGHLFAQFARRASQVRRCHPVLQRAPHDQRQEADQDRGLGAILLAVIDRAQAQVVFGDPKRVFDLGQADVSSPQPGRGVPLEVGAQQVTTVSQFGPLSSLFMTADKDRSSSFALALRIGSLLNVDLEQTGGARVGVEEPAHAPLGFASIAKPPGFGQGLELFQALGQALDLALSDGAFLFAPQRPTASPRA